jgi:amidohydrolase
VTPTWIDEFLDAHGQELVAFRHHLHANPELSHLEHRTTELIGERLRVAKLEPRVLSSGTGLICDLGDTDGPRIALRADIDALGMDDMKDVHYRSTVPGVAHGCGHDLHATVVLGAALALATRLEAQGDLPFRAGVGIRLLFEPAEESVPGGAVTVIEDGGLDDVVAVFGFHADPKVDVGLVGVRAGALTSAADVVEISLGGPGGHTARPHLTVDLVAIAGRIAHELPALVDRRCGERGELSLVFGSLQAGHAPNVIPTRAVLRGSLRTPDRRVWAEAESIVRSALDELVGSTGAEVHFGYQRGVPPVMNSAEEAELVADAVRSAIGPDCVVEAPRSRGGDTFAWYQERVPGCYARLGVHDPGSDGPRLDLHSGMFDVDDRAIDVGVRVMVRTVELLAARIGD